ncbi:DUF2512 family protein [Paenibacillus oryzisoli]|uniref:DUF2512 domain-containing protein n=1 Tax=Paenibacillus oryzisoli TaxID=1850517 RepID=A0A197ZWJ3_9BACL|nr:DUF2512 family protein [Paenibacillus oryzisoli]OAS13375.1 hypothetical protein A8708_16105 [Paenibacillus oryzisoli]
MWSMLGKLLLKLVINGIIIVPILMYLTDATFMGALSATYTFSLVTYIVVDQLFLRLTNNMAAVLADMLLTYAFFWIVERHFYDWSLSFTDMTIVAIAYGVMEFFLHTYFQKDKGRIGRHSFYE